MKIPSYQHQTGLPKQAAGQFLTTKADPNKLGLPGAAYGQLGSTVQAEGQRWFGHLLKKERATKQAAAEAAFESTVQTTISNSKRQGVDEWLTTTTPAAPPADISDAADKWRSGGLTEQRQGVTERRTMISEELYKAAQRQASTIGDPVVRSRFLSAASTRISSAMPQISTNLYAKYKDYSLAVHENTANLHERAIAQFAEGDPIGEELWVKEVGRIRYLGAEGDWDEEDIEKKINGARSRITNYRANRALSETTTVEEVEVFLKDLRGNKKFIHLTPQQLTSIERRAESRATRLNNQEIADASRADAKAERDRKTAQRIHGEEALSKISKDRIMLARGETPDEPPLTTWDIYAAPPGFYTPETRDRLIATIQGEKVIHDPALHARMIEEIYDAFDDQELADLQDEAYKLFERGGIGGKAYGELTTSIQGMRDKTPAALEKKQYAGFVKRLLVKAGVGDIYIGGAVGQAMKDDPRVPSTNASIMYENLVNEGMRPAEAYYEVALRFAEDQAEIATNVVRGMDDEIRVAFGLESPFDKIKLETLDYKQLNDAWDIWIGYASGRLEQLGAKAVVEAERVARFERRGMLTQPQVLATGITREQRIGVRALYASESALEYLTKYFQYRETIVPDTAPPVKIDPNDDPDGSKTRANDETWRERWERFMADPKATLFGEPDKSNKRF